MRNFVIGCIVLFTMAGNAFSDEPQQPRKEIAVDLGGGVNLKMVLIPAGEFMMGSRESAEHGGVLQQDLRRGCSESR